MTSICLLKKEWEEVILTLLKDIVKEINNALNAMMLINQVNVLHIWIQIIYKDGQWANIYPIIDING